MLITIKVKENGDAIIESNVCDDCTKNIIRQVSKFFEDPEFINSGTRIGKPICDHRQQ